MEVFDNITKIVRDDLTETIKPHGRVSIAAACFSIYAYQELKKQLSSIDECRFIFTSPTFVTEKTAKEKREFYIPRLSRERSFPNCVTETMKGGKVVRAIDFDMLRQELSDVVVEGPTERYQFTWPEKRKSVLAANAPITATLRPCREESVDFDTTENLYIEGDNLDVLKLLQETYLGKVKMIYIEIKTQNLIQSTAV